MPDQDKGEAAAAAPTVAVAVATPTTCKVAAPAVLKANSTFEATVDGITFTVTVPEYGVDEGESFMVPYPAAAVTAAALKNEANAFVPNGKFRRELFSGFQTCGCISLMAWLCTPCVVGQVLERLGLGYGGGPRINADGSPDKRPTPRVCMVLSGVSIFVLVIGSISSFLSVYYGFIFLGIWAWYMMLVSACVRYNMRIKFDIEGSCCGEGCWGDCLAAYFCPCCNANQMITHTHNQEEYPYSWCSRTGLSPDAPVIV